MMEAMDAILENAPGSRLDRVKTSARLRLAALASAIRWAVTLNRSRVALSELTDAQLADIGISRGEAERECRKVSLF